MKKGLLFWIILGLFATARADEGAAERLLGDVSDGSRAVPVHRINLFEEEGDKITPEDEPLLPFSPKQSCGQCHSYKTISGGWHFNASQEGVAGRVGQPWIMTDFATGTQIPLSYRAWDGTYRPEQVGLSSWGFTQLFGARTAGGGVGEVESDNPDEVMRQFVSGKLEINCLACHDGDADHDQAEYAGQVRRENFRWAAASACSFADVSGSAKDMPDTYDPLMPEVFDDPKLVPPTVVYREGTFDHKNRVLFDIVRDIPNERCYFCHSTTRPDEKGEKWQNDEDVHIAAGLSCVDCHRNGTEHNIIRGYEGEEYVSANPAAGNLSCKGCHIESENNAAPTEGRLGAPIAVHKGIPAVHFDKLSCTACHSGLWPEEKSGRVKTSIAHGLGTHNVNKSKDALPHIVSGVFAKQADGKIAPANLIWPAYWGRLKEGVVKPIALEDVRSILASVVQGSAAGDWPDLNEEKIGKLLQSLSSEEGKAVYICGGKMYQLSKDNTVVGVEAEQANPYLWPIAHNVRPTAQSIGVRGCGDCHTSDNALLFGEVEIDGPLASQAGAVKKMTDFSGLDPLYTKLFAMSFVFRPMLKVVAFGSCGVLGLILLLYGLKALGCVTKVLVGKD